MDDATLGHAINYVGIGLAIVPSLLFLWLGNRLWRPALIALCRSTARFVRLLRAGISLFIGLMLASAGGVLIPQLWMPSAHLLCDGQVSVSAQDYSYKPGQHGTSMTVTCTEDDGTQTRITLASIFLSALLYGLALFVLMELIGALLRGVRRDPPTASGGQGSPPWQTPGVQSGFEKFLQRNEPSVSTDGIEGLQHLSDKLRRVLPGEMSALVQQALEASARKHAGSATVIVNGQHVDVTHDDLAERLQKLKKLHDAGLIDDDEYAAKKSSLLNDL